MNLGWYEIMDRIAMIQNDIDYNVYHHGESDEKLKTILEEAQRLLSNAYDYAQENVNE